MDDFTKRTAYLLWAFLLAVPVFGQGRDGGDLPATTRNGAQRLALAEMSRKPLAEGLFGAMAVTLDGDTLLYCNAGSKLLPASTMKLITTGLAMKILGPDYRFPTRLGYRGPVEEGTLKGDLYLLGGGDPTLGSRDSIALPADTLFRRWAGFLEKAGIRRIEGELVGDGSYFDGEMENPNWSYEDLGTFYGAGGNGLSFYRNIVDFKVMPGEAEGDPVSITVLRPELPWLDLVRNCTTGAKNSGNRLFLYGTDLSHTVEMRGTLAEGLSPIRLECSNKFGDLTCACAFSRYLQDKGLPHSGFSRIDGFGRRGAHFPLGTEGGDGCGACEGTDGGASGAASGDASGTRTGRDGQTSGATGGDGACGVADGDVSGAADNGASGAMDGTTDYGAFGTGAGKKGSGGADKTASGSASGTRTGRDGQTFGRTGGDGACGVADGDSLVLIGTTWSPKLKEIARLTNYRSDNFYAEALLRGLTRQKKGSADYQVCRKYFREALARLGVDGRRGFEPDDGSGLSRRNYVSPEFFCRFLRAMAASEVYESYLYTLASPGKGHYQSRLKNEEEALKKRIFLKSGSMNGVRCFCGYILPASGKRGKTIVFSIMTNNCTASDRTVYPILDRIIAALARQNGDR